MGHYEINRRFKNVGLIRMSLGTSDIREFRRRVALVEKLHRQERYELLRRLRDKNDRDVTIEFLIEADREERLGSAASDLSLNQNLWEAIERTLPRMGNKETAKRYAVSLRALQEKAGKHLGPNARVRALASAPWSEISKAWGNSAADWMHVKRAISRFLTVFLRDKYHPFARKWRSDFPGRKVRPKRVNVPLSLFLKVSEQSPEHARASYWALYVTGMRVRSEYLRCDESHLEDADCRIKVPGTKTEGSENTIAIDPRLWHLVQAGIPSRLKYKWLRIYWRRACEAVGVSGITLHDLRHGAGQLARKGGATQEDVQDFLRHETSTVTRDYLRLGTTLAVSRAIADQLDGHFHRGKRTKSVKRRG